MLVCGSENLQSSAPLCNSRVELQAQAQAHPLRSNVPQMAGNGNRNVSNVWLINAPVQRYSVQMQLYLYNESIKSLKKNCRL